MTLLAFLLSCLLVGVTPGVPPNLLSPDCSPAASGGSETKIIGGTEASIAEFPHQLRIENAFCGAVLIRPNVAITSASCVEVTERYEVVAGDLDVCELEELTEQIRGVKSIVVHPQYDQDTLEKDLAILLLDSPFNITHAVKPIRLAPEGFNPKGRAIVTGWGRTKKSLSSRYLLKVDVPIWSAETCELSYPGFVFPTTICAGEFGKGACNGDNGGPLIFAGGSDGGIVPEESLLIGITSWGRGCGYYYFSALFTEVSHFLPWISSVISG